MSCPPTKAVVVSDVAPVKCLEQLCSKEEEEETSVTISFEAKMEPSSLPGAPEHPGHIVLVPGMSRTCKLSSCSCDNPLATSQTHRAYASPEQAHYNCRRRLQSLQAPQALPVRGGSAACRQLGAPSALLKDTGHRPELSGSPSVGKERQPVGLMEAQFWPRCCSGGMREGDEGATQSSGEDPAEGPSVPYLPACQ